MPDATQCFISDPHQDFVVAAEIRTQIMNLAQHGEGGNHANCFLDTESIQPGQKYGPVIKSALEVTDWLIVVFTGDQSVDCGFEIGLYSSMGDFSKPQEEKPVVAFTTSTEPNFRRWWLATTRHRSTGLLPTYLTMRRRRLN